MTLTSTATPPTNLNPDDFQVPDHVLSVKVLSDFKRNQDLNQASISDGIPKALSSFNLPQHDSGENCEVPELLNVNRNRLLEEIKMFKKRLGDKNLTTRIIEALKEVEENVSNLAPKKRGLVKKKKVLNGNVDPANIAHGKRKVRKLNVKVSVPSLKDGDRVKILTSRFGARYAEGRERFTY